MRSSLNSRFLFSLIFFTGLAVLFVRVGDVWSAIDTGHFFSRAAFAETAPSNSTPPTAETDKKPAVQSDPVVPGQDSSGSAHYNMDDQDRSPAEMEVLNQLSQRREELDNRNKDLDTREDLIKVAEQRVDQKIKEMETLRGQLQSMVNQVSEGQATQIENLVKIYETMKPDEAARIFETLDMPVLLGVIQRMKPTRTAPILAKMAPEKAKEVTVALSHQDQLPQIK